VAARHLKTILLAEVVAVQVDLAALVADLVLVVVLEVLAQFGHTLVLLFIMQVVEEVVVLRGYQCLEQVPAE
jgi:hypothetical protein